MVHEPMTVFTDFLLGAWTAFLGWRLWAEGRAKGDRATSFWSLAFFFSSIAAFAGGSVHGFPHWLGAFGQALLWKVTVQAVGIAGLSFLFATIRVAFRGGVRTFLLAAALVKWSVYAIWMTKHDLFLYVVLDYLPTLLFVGGVQTWLWWKKGSVAGRRIACGVGLSLMAAAVQRSGLVLHPHFNHNDLYHVIQMIAFYWLFSGGKGLREGR